MKSHSILLNKEHPSKEKHFWQNCVMRSIYQKTTAQKGESHSGQAAKNIPANLVNVNAEEYLRRVERLHFPWLYNINKAEYCT